ncbi:MAG: hypothetical protein V3U09_04165 [Thermoplasmata archaeon]
MSTTDAYISSVSRHLRGMDSKVKSDILNELRAHITDMASEPEMNAEKAISRMESPKQMAKMYKDLYGYGFAYKAVFAVLAVLISIPSLPIFLPVFDIAEDPTWISIVFFGAATFYLIGVSVVAGKHVGLYTGVIASITRFVILGLMFVFYSEAALGGTIGILSFAISSLLLIAIGYLPGEAKQRWEGKSPVI